MITTIPNADGRGEAPAERDYTLGRTAAGRRPGLGRGDAVVPPAKEMGRGEKARICREAQTAFKYLASTGALADFQPELPEYKRCENWRREQLAVHFGIASLTLATQDQFNSILAHFECMTPDGAPRAFNRGMRGDGDANRRRQALWKIKKACEESGLAWPAYPLSIASMKFKASTLDALTPAQAWKLYFDMTNRSKTHRAAPKPAPPAVEEEGDPF